MGGLGGRGTSDCLLGLCYLTALTIATSWYVVGSKLSVLCPGHADVVAAAVLAVAVAVAIEQSLFNTLALPSWQVRCTMISMCHHLED